MNNMEQFRIRIGRNVYDRRLRLKLTQGEVAQRTKLGTWRVISEIERGKREATVGELSSIAKALYCGWQDLFERPTCKQSLLVYCQIDQGGGMAA